MENDTLENAVPSGCPLCGSAAARPFCEKSGYSISKCAQCSGVFVSPLPSRETLTAFYENYYKTPQYQNKLDSKIRRATKRIGLLGNPAGKRFIDVGCNVGFAVEAARRLGYQAKGIEVNSKAIAMGRSLFPEADLACEDLFQVDPATKFDVVYCSEVIEHVLEPLAFIRAIRGIMADNAILYITTPDAGHWSVSQTPAGFAQWSNVRPPEHLFYFNRTSLGRLLQANGFTKVRFGLPWKSTLRVTAST